MSQGEKGYLLHSPIDDPLPCFMVIYKNVELPPKEDRKKKITLLLTWLNELYDA